MNQSSKKAVPKPEHMTALANYIATHAPNDWRYGYVFAHHDFETGAHDMEGWEEMSLKLSNKGEVELDFKYKKTS